MSTQPEGNNGYLKFEMLFVTQAGAAVTGVVTFNIY
jgi:hypothetical protein